MGKMKITTEIVRVYANQQRTMTNERLFKTNPIEPNFPPIFQNPRLRLGIYHAESVCRMKRNPVIVFDLTWAVG